MNASPAWLEDMARGAAARDARRERPQPEWGQPRLSRRRLVGTAASTMVAASALRFVSPAFAQAPQCLSPCLKDAADGIAAAHKRNRRGLDSRMTRLQDQYDDLRSAKSRAKTAKGRAKIQRQIDANLRKQLGVLDTYRDYEEQLYDSLLEKNDKCKSSPECGDPAKFPGGQAPQGPATGQCGDPAAACGDLCCASLTRCCSSCKVCCVDGVACKDCCGN